MLELSASEKDLKGVYCIRNTKTNQVYVGATTTSFERRIKRHVQMLRKGNHHCRHLQNSWNIYSDESFAIEVLEVCTKEILFEREKFWWDHFTAQGVETFNRRPNGERYPELSPTQEARRREKISKTQKELIASGERLTCWQASVLIYGEDKARERQASWGFSKGNIAAKALKGKSKSKNHKDSLSAALKAVSAVKLPCPHCGKSFSQGGPYARHIKSCSLKQSN